MSFKIVIMKNIFLVILFITSSFSWGQSNTQDQILNSTEKLPIWIDIRTAEEHEEGTIGEAVNIDFYSDDFLKKMNSYDKTQEIIIFCQSGGRSAEASELLKEDGFQNIIEFQGGYEEYITNNKD